jgi:hypothetical protein
LDHCFGFTLDKAFHISTTSEQRSTTMLIPATNAARRIAYTRRSWINLTKRASFHFASSEYAACFQGLPTPDTAMLRSATLDYLTGFNRQEWFQSPILSLLTGQELGDGSETDTIDGIGNVNGRQKLATVDEVQRIKDFIRSYSSPYNDLREPIRKIEAKLLTDYAGFLIGNQCIGMCFQARHSIPSCCMPVVCTVLLTVLALLFPWHPIRFPKARWRYRD